MMAQTETTRGELARKALDLLDTNGPEAMTVEWLAEEVALSEDDIRQILGDAVPLDLACEAIYSEIELAPQDRPWPARLRHNARQFREVLVLHPSVVIPIATRPIVSADAMKLAEDAIANLTEFGFDPVEANQVLLVIVNYVIGHALSEVGVGQQLDHRSSVREFRKNLSAEELPLAAVALHEPPDRDAEFELGLNLLVDGLERRLLHG